MSILREFHCNSLVTIMPLSALRLLVGFQLACYSAENKLRKAPRRKHSGGGEPLPQYVVQRPAAAQQRPGGGNPNITCYTGWEPSEKCQSEHFGIILNFT